MTEDYSLLCMFLMVDLDDGPAEVIHEHDPVLIVAHHGEHLAGGQRQLQPAAGLVLHSVSDRQLQLGVSPAASLLLLLAATPPPEQPGL